jgi:hypothetical protein
MKKVIKLKESDLQRIVKRVISESYEGGSIQVGDVPCDIHCKRKLAKSGSNGDVVKYIQHLLAVNGFNPKYQGGGIGLECGDLYQGCDGKYRKHTKNAVIEFQRKYKLSVDGVVGYDTLNKMCEVLKPGSATRKETLEAYNKLCIKQCQCKKLSSDEPFPKRKSPIKGPNIDFDDIDVYNPINKVKCGTLKSCVYKYILTDRGVASIVGRKVDYEGFIGCLGLKDIDIPRKPKKGCKSDDGRDICNIIPDDIPFGRPTISVMGYYYDPSKGKCVSVSGGSAPFRQMEKCRECCERK